MTLAHDIDQSGLGAVLRTALDAVVVMRVDGTIGGWNEVAARTFGWTFAEAGGRRMSEMIIPHRHRAAHEHGLSHYLATGDGPVLDKHFEIEALHRDGHEMPIELSITRTVQPGGEPVFLGFLRDIGERRAAERRQALLIGELHHRVKNLLGVVVGIADQTARTAVSIEEFGPAFTGRLSSLGRAHEVLTAGAWNKASLDSLARSLLGPYTAHGQDRVTFGGPELLLSPRQTLGLSMILHELLTNAVKYGALSRDKGSVALGWSVEAARARVTWTEADGAGTTPPAHRGFGMRMIAMSVQNELFGDIEQEWLADGMRFSVAFDVHHGQATS